MLFSRLGHLCRSVIRLGQFGEVQAQLDFLLDLFMAFDRNQAG